MSELAPAFASFRRINVVGTSGSGKTTFSRQLAEILAIPHIEMDAIYWRSNWQGLPDEEFLPKLAEAVARDSWILDGNYTRTTPVKWAHVDCVVWLDFPFLQTVTRVLRRAFRRSMTGEELWDGTGNRETLAKCLLSRDSIVVWAIQTHGPNRRKYAKVMQDPNYRHVTFIHIRSARERDEVLERFASVAGT